MLKLCLLLLVASVVYVELSEANNRHTNKHRSPQAHVARRSIVHKAAHTSQHRSGNSVSKHVAYKSNAHKQALHKSASNNGANSKFSVQKQIKRKAATNRKSAKTNANNKKISRNGLGNANVHKTSGNLNVQKSNVHKGPRNNNAHKGSRNNNGHQRATRKPSPLKPKPAPRKAKTANGKTKLVGGMNTKPWKNTDGKRPPIGKGGVMRLRMKPQDAVKDCDDKASNCAEFHAFCTDSKSKGLMKQNCAKTCGYCPLYGDDCQDRVTNCKYWSTKGFCQSDIIYPAEKRSVCAKTCDMCLSKGNPSGCDKNPYNDECIASTCKKPTEQDKPECAKYCSAGGKGEKEEMCKCTNTANKYKQWCAEKICQLPDEKKRDSGCRDFCDKNQNAKLAVCDCLKPENKMAYWCVYPDCVHQNDTSYYTDACVEKTCSRPSEKRNAGTNSCLELCLTDANKDLPACDCGSEVNRGTAEWCKLPESADCKDDTNPVKFFSDKCVPVNCADIEEKKKPDSPCYVKCKDPKHENTATCSCSFADNRKYASWCKSSSTAPIKPDCHPGNKLLDPTKYYGDDCVETVCALQGEKEDAGSLCRKKCLEPAHSDKKACSCLEANNKNGKATWCDPNCYNRLDTALYFGDPCLDISCARPNEKLLWGPNTCKAKCEVAPGNTKDVCLCTNPKNSEASWCAAVKTYTKCTDANDVRDECNEVRCADPGQKQNPKCEAYCAAGAAGAGKDPCKCTDPKNKFSLWCKTDMGSSCPISGTSAAVPWGDCYYHCKLRGAGPPPTTECTCTGTSTSDFCLEQNCQTRGPLVLPECQKWCSTPKNINRKGCIVP